MELGVNDQLTAGLRRAQRQLQQFGANVQGMGLRMMAVSAAAAAPFVAATKVGAAFEQRMARVRALTGATEADFQRLSKAAERLGMATIFSASQAAEAMSFFALAGFKVDQILKAIGPTLDLAAAGQLEIAQAADIAAKIMAGMGLSADELASAVDILTKAMTTANTDLGQLGDAMKFVGPIAKSAGLAFEEVVAAIQLLSNAGIQAEMAGTTLRGMILALTSPSSEASKELQRLGVQVNDASGNVRPLADIIMDLNNALAGMGTGRRLDILGRIFPARTAAGVAELLSQGGDRLREFTKALEGAGGTATRIADIQLNTLTGSTVLLKSALEGLGIAVSDAYKGPLRAVVHTITKAVTAMIGWVHENQAIVAMAAAAVVAVGAFGSGLVALGIAIKAAAFVVGGLAIGFGAIGTVLGFIYTHIGLVSAAVLGLGYVVGTQADAIGQAVDWMGERWRRLKAVVTDVLRGITDALKAGDIELAAKILWLALKAAWQVGINALNQLWQDFKAAFVSTAYDMWHGFLAAYEWAAAELKKLFASLMHSIGDLWNSEFGKGWRNAIASLIHAMAKVVVPFQFIGSGLSRKERLAAIKEAEAQIDRDLAEVRADIEKGDDDWEAKGDAEYRQRLAEIERKKEDALVKVAERLREAQDALKAQADASLEETAEELRKATEELDAAIEEARRKKDAAADVDGEESTRRTKRGTRIAAIQDVLARVSAMNRAAERIDVVGTFNAQAARQLGGSSELTLIARYTKETAENTREGARFG